TDTRLQRVVALKLPRAQGPAAVERLIAEARAQARVQHPNVVALHEAAVFDGQLALVLEWCDGPTLRAWQVGRPAPEVLGAYLEAARGLAAAHRRGIVHRDFKPDNVVVDADGRVRVTDFGLASGAGELARSAGTPAYMAPETWRHGQCDARSDQYAFALALVEALTGSRRPEVGLKGLPGALAAVLGRALAPEPEARWPTMHALLEAVETASSRRRRRALVAVAALGLAAVPVAVAARPGPCDALRERALTLEERAPSLLRGRLDGLSSGHCLPPAGHACAQRFLDEVGALVAVAALEPTLADHVPQAMDRLAPLASCATRPVAELSESPSAELEAARVSTARSELLRRVGREPAALAAADEAVSQARQGHGHGTLARALLARGRALSSLGRPDEAVEVLRDAERAASAAHAEAARIDAQLAQVMELCRGLGATDACAEAYRRARDAAVDPSPAMTLELLELGAAVLGQQANTQSAQAQYEVACAGWARQADRQLELERCQLSLAINSETAGLFARALQLSRAVSASARTVGAQRRLAQALRLEASLSLSTGDLQGAARAVGEAEAETASTGRDRARLEAVRAQLLEATGDLGGAVESQRRAVALAGATHPGWARKQRLVLASWLGESGRWDEATALFEALAAEVPDWEVRSNGDTMFGVQALAWLALRRGDAHEAARLSDWVAQSARSRATAPRYLVPVLAWRAERLLDAGRLADAREQVAELDALLGGLVGAGPGLEGPIRLLRARLSAVDDRTAAGRAAQALRVELEARGYRGRVVAEAVTWALVWSGEACRRPNERSPFTQRVDGLAAGRSHRSALKRCALRESALSTR
ncbi:MAG: serine/threonine protein kinase, partial [Myxococcaceae bacterium]|nr:serine/threonine protein kinase [Myxococcaceae bacterium]